MKLVKESITPERPEYYPEEIEKDYYDKHEPWKKNPETDAIMEKMLDEYESKWNSLEEVDYDQVLDIKQALWIGYNFGKKKESSWQPTPPIRDQEGNITSDWRDRAVQ